MTFNMSWASSISAATKFAHRPTEYGAILAMSENLSAKEFTILPSSRIINMAMVVAVCDDLVAIARKTAKPE